MSLNLPASPEFGTPVPQLPHLDVLTFLATRRSASAMSLAEPGPSPDEVSDLIRLAARVPDHGKLAPWRFILLEGSAKTRFAHRLQQLAESRGDQKAVTKLGKLKAPPMGIAVISSPRDHEIRTWEQHLSAGAVCTTLLYAAQALGYGANWITDWYAYDAEAQAILGLSRTESVAGFIFIGTAEEPPKERERPEIQSLITDWRD